MERVARVGTGRANLNPCGTCRIVRGGLVWRQVQVLIAIVEVLVLGMHFAEVKTKGNLALEWKGLNSNPRSVKQF